MSNVPFKSITLTNFLSFGPQPQTLEMGPLTVLIGPNGSGKSNLLEAFALLKAAPRGDLAATIKAEGSFLDWVFQPQKAPSKKLSASATLEKARLSISLNRAAGPPKRFPAATITHDLALYGEQSWVGVLSEKIELFNDSSPRDTRPFRFSFDRRTATVTASNEAKPVKIQTEVDSWKFDESALSQLKDPYRYGVFHTISSMYQSIALFNVWEFGRNSALRRASRLGSATDFIDDAFDNFTAVVADVLPKIEDEVMAYLRELLPYVSGIGVKPSGNKLQIYLREGKRITPAARLSDGTLRFIFMLCALLHPNARGRLIAIDEPELGFHPDVIPTLAKLLKEATQERGVQVVITTHSDILVNCFSDMPDVIAIAEMGENGTELKRLDPEQLKHWLKDYGLGDLWMKGSLGGTRW